MITRDSFFKLFAGLLCFCLQVGCSDDNDPLPKSSDITFEIKEEGLFAIVDVSVAGVSQNKIEECGIEWKIIPEDDQILIGDQQYTIISESKRSTHTFRIFPWSHFFAKSYNYKCRISVTPYVRVNGQLVKGYGKPKEIRTNTDVSVWTHKSEIIDTYHIRFYGYISQSDELEIEECGIYWSEEESFDLKDYTKCISTETSPEFTVTVRDIAHLEKVYVIGYVKTPDGIIYSDVSGAYLPGDKVTITISSEVKDPTFERVTVSGHCTVENPAIYPITARGFCYRLKSDSYLPTIENNKITVEPGEGAFTGTITGMEPFTYYTIRAYAISNGRVTYSKSINTYTLYSYMFTPTTRFVSANVNPSHPGQVLLEGKVTDNCGYMVTERGFCYNTSGQSPTIDDNKIVADDIGLGSFKAEVKLSPGKYFFKSYAINQAGIKYSSDYKEVVVK